MLHIWLASQQASIFVWQEVEASWKAFDNWQSIADNFKEKKACLYFPSNYLLQLENDLSSKQLKQLGETGQQYLFEDMSLASVEQLVVKSNDNAGHQRLFACSKTDIEQWQNAAFIAGIQIQALLPDFLLLPVVEEGEANKIFLYQDKQTTLVREAVNSGTAVGYLPLYLSKLDLVTEVVILSPVHNSVIDTGFTVESLQEYTEALVFSRSVQSLKPEMKALRHSLNFAIESKNKQRNPYLMVTAMVMVAALFVQIFVDGVSSKQLKTASVDIHKNIQAQFQHWFPEQRLNSRTGLQPQMQPYLVNNESNNDVLSVFNRVSKIIGQSKTSAKDILIDEKQVKIQLLARNRNELDKVVKNMVQQGIKAELGSINNLSSPIEADMGEYSLVSEVVIAQDITDSL